MSYHLQVRHGRGRYKTVASAQTANDLAWGWNQCVDPRYSAGDSVRIIRRVGDSVRTIMRVTVSEP